MSGFRLVLVTRRFWPMIGGAETVMASLAARFQARGHHTTIVTARWQADWPIEVEHHGVRVVRIANATQRYWGTWQYMRGLSRWLARHRPQFDLAYVSMLKHDAYVSVKSGCVARFPVVLRAECSGESGDCRWQETANFGRVIRSRCRGATALVAISPEIRQELIGSGYARDKIVEIRNGVQPRPARQAGRQAEARAALASGNPALKLGTMTPLAVYTGRLNTVKDLATLVASWPSVLKSHADARLWIVGEGPERGALEAQIARLRLRGHVVLTGAFDNVDEVLAAADLFVLPSREEGMSLSLLEAMAHGLPVVVSDIAASRNVVVPGKQGLLVPPGSSDELASAICTVLAQPGLAAQLGAAARDRVSRDFSLEASDDRHLELFKALIRPARNPS